MDSLSVPTSTSSQNPLLSNSSSNQVSEGPVSEIGSRYQELPQDPVTTQNSTPGNPTASLTSSQAQAQGKRKAKSGSGVGAAATASKKRKSTTTPVPKRYVSHYLSLKLFSSI